MMKTRRHRDNLKISIQNFEVLIVLIVTNLYWSDQTLLIFLLGGLTQVYSPPVGKQGNVDKAVTHSRPDDKSWFTIVLY